MTHPEMEEMAEKKLVNGNTVTLAKAYQRDGYDVECWDKNYGNRLWIKWFPILPEAMTEYNHWN